MSAALAHGYFILLLLRRQLQLPASWKNCLMAISDFTLSHLALTSSHCSPLVFALSSFPSLPCLGLDFPPCHTSLVLAWILSPGKLDASDKIKPAAKSRGQ